MSEILYEVGEPVEPRDVAVPDTGTPLIGRSVTLTRLDPETQAARLLDATQGDGADPHMWDYLPYGPFGGLEDFTGFLAGFATSTDPLIYAFTDTTTGAPIGFGGYLRIDVPNRVIEIGHLCFGKAMQRDTTATETISLLIRHAFDLGYRRVEWKCNALHVRSKRAALRFGFTYEGTFRQHVIVKGRNRDTAWFAMMDHEWPAIGAGFERWLAPDNFDETGRQRSRLQMPST